MFRFLLLVIFKDALSKDYDRSILLRDLHPSMGNQNLMESLIETVERSKHASASSNDRRRTVHDRDCDDYRAKIDDIEDDCSKYRYEILVSIQPNYTRMVQTNSTLFGRFLNLDKAINGDPLSTETSSGILKTLLAHRIAIYGGVDPVSNRMIPGAISQLTSIVNGEFALHDHVSSSLDTVWTMTNNSFITVANILYNQVYNYATTAENMTKMMQTAGDGILALNDDQLATGIRGLNRNLITLINEICSTQKNLTAYGKAAFNSSDDTYAVLDDVLNKLMTESDRFLDLLDQKSREADAIIDSLTDGSDRVMTNGIEAIEMMANSFVTTFKNNIGKLISAFDSQRSAALDMQQKSLSDMITAGSAELVSAIDTKTNSVDAKRSNLLDKISALRKELAEATSRVRSALLAKMTNAEESMHSQKDNTTRSLSNSEELQRQMKRQLDFAGQQVDQGPNDLQSQLSKQNSNAASIGQSQLIELVSSMERVRQSMLTSVANTQTSLSDTIQKTEANVGEDTVAAGNVLSDHSSMINAARVGGQAHVQLIADVASSSIGSNLSPLLGSLTQIGSDIVKLAKDAAAAGSAAASDAKSAIAAGSLAAQHLLRSASVDGLVTASALTNQLAQLMGSITKNQDGSSHSLTGAKAKLVDQDAAIASLLSVSKSLTDKAAQGLGSIEDQFGDLNDRFARSIDGRIRNGLSLSGGKISDLGSKTQAQIKTREAELSSQILNLISYLKSNPSEVVGGYTDKQILVDTLKNLELQISNITTRQDTDLNGFNRTIAVSGNNIDSMIADFLIQQGHSLENLSGQPPSSELDVRKSIASEISRIDDLFSMAVPPSVESTLAVLGLQLPGAQFKTEKVDQDIRGIENRVKGLSQRLDAYERTTSDRLSDMERSLLQMVNKTGEDFFKRFRLSPEFLAQTVQGSSSSVRGDIARAAESAALDRLMSSETTMENDLNIETGNDTRSVESIDAILDKVRRDVNSLFAQNSMNVQNGRAGLDSAADYAKLAAAMAKGIVKNMSDFTTSGKMALDKALARATAISEQIDSAVGWQGRAIEQQIGRGGNRNEFQATSDGIQASQLSGSAASSVADALETVSSFRSSLDAMLSDSSVRADETRTFVTQSGSEIDKAYDAMNMQKDHQASILKSRMTIEQKMNELKLANIRKFTGQVRDAWLRYVDTEDEKFKGMSDSDKTYFSNLLRVATNGFDSGSQKIGFTNSTINQVFDLLNTVNLNFKDFEFSLSDKLSKTSEDLRDSSQSASDLNLSLTSMIDGLRAGMNETDSSDRMSIESKLKDFEASLDDISNRVVQSLSPNISLSQ
jgi:hypothetical protein